MPQAVGAAVLGEVGLASLGGAAILGIGAESIVGFAVLTAATGGLTITLTTEQEPGHDGSECDLEA